MVYCCSDLHGQLELYEKARRLLNPEDKMIFLGDACDRWPDGWKIIKAILKDPQWIYLKGNHEDMLIQNYRAVNELAEWVHFRNGGESTITACRADKDAAEIIDKLDNLPLVYKYKNWNGKEFWLTHAGYTPKNDINPYSNVYSSRDLIWGRDHCTEIDFDPIQDTYIIHGHTPVEYMPNDCASDGKFIGDTFASPYLYGNGMKIDIDMGCFYTHKLCVYNLDTMTYLILRTQEVV